MGLKMKKNLLIAGIAAAAATLAVAAPASADVAWTFINGPAHSPSDGFTIVSDFDNATPLAGWIISDPSKVYVTNTDTWMGAPPANSDPAGTNYLDVTEGGTATLNLASPVQYIEFDWGSVDTFNALTVFTTGGAYTINPPNPSDGNQSSSTTNGLFIATATNGQKITGISLASSGMSYEIDNVAVRAVPEPATWALMILGIGGIGALMRRQRDQGLANLA
jgi:hypothetical protein